MSFSRKIRREKEKAARKSAKKIDKMISKMPQKCTRCNTYFDKSLKENLDKWHIDFAQNKFDLYCPSCYALESK